MVDDNRERAAALSAMYTPRAPVSRYASMSARERQFNDFIMNPLNWIGLGVVRAGAAKLAGSRLVRFSGTLKRPINTMYAQGFGFKGPSIMAQRVLNLRKKGNTLLLGYSALNPLENLHYAKNRDWEKLIVNYHFPIVGVPIYSQLTGGSGAPAGRVPIRTSKPAKRGYDPLGKKPKWRRYPPIRGSKQARSGPFTYKGRTKAHPSTKKSRCPRGHYWSKRYKKCVRYRKR